jgi:hypothetical protein
MQQGNPLVLRGTGESKVDIPRAPPPKKAKRPALPPGWTQESSADGEVYFTKPDGETTWDDPRST